LCNVLRVRPLSALWLCAPLEGGNFWGTFTFNEDFDETLKKIWRANICRHELNSGHKIGVPHLTAQVSVFSSTGTPLIMQCQPDGSLHFICPFNPVSPVGGDVYIISRVHYHCFCLTFKQQPGTAAQ